MLHMTRLSVAVVIILTAHAPLDDKPTEKGTKATMKKSDERLEVYEMDLTLAEADKERFLKDIPKFMEELVEKQGHKVNRMYVTTDFEKRAREAIQDGKKGSPVTLRPRHAHIVYPPEERSGWI